LHPPGFLEDRLVRQPAIALAGRRTCGEDSLPGRSAPVLSAQNLT
jgi:hypothetical protein